MDNPFVKDGFLSENASINKVYIEKVPTDKVKQDLQGKTAADIFSTKLFIEEIKKNGRALKLDINSIEEKRLPQYLDECLESSDASVEETANAIVRLFGERLAVILLTLKKGEKENRLKRKDWSDSSWDYWRSLKNVILVGGLSNSKTGEKLKYYVEKVFREAKEEGYNIILTEDSSNAGIRGCCTYIDGEDDKLYLILDCGQSFIKRSLVRLEGNKVKNIIKLEKVLSKHVEWNFEAAEKEKCEAAELHNYILNVITAAIESAEAGAENIGGHIVISIANYVKNGLLANRGGYGKLRLLSDNYEVYLSDALYKKINKSFRITLVHDGTAMAAAFSDYPDSVCISLGTAFGVGFPINEKNI